MNDEEKFFNELRDNTHWFKTIDCKMMDYTMDLSKIIIKGTFILNGSAAIAMLTLFTKVLVEKPSISYDILLTTYCFAIGALLSTIGATLSYFLQRQYQNDAAQTNDIECYEIIEKYHNIFNTSSSYREQISEEKREKQESKEKTSKLSKRWFFSIIIVLIASFVMFFLGITQTVYTFSKIDIGENMRNYSFLHTNYTIKHTTNTSVCLDQSKN